jgi:hypothetical protein
MDRFNACEMIIASSSDDEEDNELLVRLLMKGGSAKERRSIQRILNYETSVVATYDNQQVCDWFN